MEFWDNANWDLLTEREQTVLRMRAGGRSLITIGKQFGVTRERIRQLERKALVKLGSIPEKPTVAPPPKVYPSPETLARHKRAAMGLEIVAEQASVLDAIWYRAYNVMEMSERYDWDLPDYIIGSQLRYLREAIEKWEAEHEEV